MTRKNRKYRKHLLVMLLAVCLTGGSVYAVSQPESSAAADTTVQETAAAVDVSELFSDRDLSGEWDASEAVAISLKGTTASCQSESVTIDGGTVTITAAGTYVLEGNLEDGMILVDAGDEDKVQLVLNGVTITSSTSAAIYVRNADKTFLTLAENTSNTLTNGGSFVNIDDNNIDGVIFSKDDLTLNGSGTLTVNSPAGHGIVGKDELTITGGTYEISAAEHGLSGKDCVSIADGNFHITTGEDGIHGDNDEDASKGFVYIGGGTYVISAGDDGIHSSSGLAVAGGTVDVTESYEGLEGLSIDIVGGTITVKSSDDGLNAAGGNDGSGMKGSGNDMFAVTEGCAIHISGGSLAVNAEGDGIDSNGSITISGGTTTVAGPTSSGNGALDYNGSCLISGGTLIAAGAAGMVQNVSQAENQGAILVNTGSQQAGTTISVTDSSGNVLTEWTAEKSYECVVISCAGIEAGGTYTVTAGTYSESITMSSDSLVYGSGSGMGGRGGHGGMGGQGGFGGHGGKGGKGNFDGGNARPGKRGGSPNPDSQQ